MEPRICCFTGHRRLPWGTTAMDPRCMGFQALLAQELEEAWREGFRVFWCGMARGADLLFAEAVLACQMVHPEVELYAAIPCPNQTRGWPQRDTDRYWHIIRFIGSRHTALISRSWDRGCMHRRNEYMVDCSDRVIALYDGKSGGGTQFTLDYARKQGMERVIIDPWTLRIQREGEKKEEKAQKDLQSPTDVL